MKNFIFRKWDIIHEENKKSGTSVYLILLKKIVGKIVSTPFLAVDIFLVCVFSPLMVVVAFLFKFGKKKKIIFFIGLEHLINKTAERGIGYLEKGFMSYFFSFEWSGMKHSLPFDAPIVKYSFSIFIDTIVFLKSLVHYKPSYVEVYFEGNAYRQLFAVALAKINGCLLVSIERGVWHGFMENRVSFLLGWRYILIFKMSTKIFYRELGLFEIYDSYKLPRDKFIFDYNKVKVYEEPSYTKSDNSKNVLYLNGFKSFRRLDLFIKAIPIVKSRIPEASFTIVGARSEEDVVYVNTELKRLSIEDVAEVFFWDAAPRKYYEKASVFVLPAELVFCNFSLIEAMERGLPVVVTNVVDADKIVEHNKNGILCEMSEQGIANAILDLLLDESKRVEFGKNARVKIINEFNSDNRLDPILDIIRSTITFYEN